GAEPARGVLVRPDTRACAESPDRGAGPVRVGGARARTAAGRGRDARLPPRLDEDLDLDRLRARRPPLLRAGTAGRPARTRAAAGAAAHPHHESAETRARRARVARRDPRERSAVCRDL